MSFKRISLALATAALSAGLLTAVGAPAQAAPATSAPAASAAAASAAAKKPNYKPIPAVATTTAGVAKKGLDFGYITKVTLKDGTLKIRFDRAEFYTGKAAAKRNGGEIPPNDYLVENSSSKLRTFTVSKKASLIGVNELRGYPETLARQTITRKQLVKNFKKSNGEVAVWLRHTDGDKGTVTALAEQYIP